jgi:hypothetical protein
MNNYQKAHPLELLLFTHCCLDAGKTSFTENGATVRVLPESSETILFFPIDKCNLGSHLWKGQEGKSICDLIVYYAKEDRRVLCFVELKKSRQELDDHAVMQVVSALLLNSCHKKQENQAAIFKRFSTDAASNAFRALVNRIPLTVT